MKLFIYLLFGILLTSLSPSSFLPSVSSGAVARLSFVSTTYANDTIIVPVTTKIPGCIKYYKDANKTKATEAKDIKYCEMKKGFGGVLEVIGKLIKAGTFLTFLAGVLFLVIQGIMLASGTSEVEQVKKNIFWGVAGLTLLTLSGTILHMIAPWIYV